MNQTAASAPGASLLPDTTDLFTTGAFIVIAILMALVIAGIIFGARLSRRRKQARAELQEYNAQIERQTPPPPHLTPTLAPEAREAPAPVPPAAVQPAFIQPEPPREPAPPPIPRAAPAPEIRREPPVVTVAPTSRQPTPAEPAPAATSPADGPVTQLKGLGPKVATRLAELGITTVGQMAALTDDRAQALDAQLGAFTGRMGRDRWQEQARFLAAGDVRGFEAVFGRL